MPRYARWVILLFPFFLTGCFESKSAANRINRDGMGIAAISRHFPAGRQTYLAKASERASLSDLSSFFPAGSSWTGELPINAENLDIALPGYIGSGRRSSAAMLSAATLQSRIFGKAGAGRKPAQDSALLASNPSFSQFFSAVFGNSTDLSIDDAEDLANPFSEARQKQQQVEEAPVPENESETAEKSTTGTEESAQKTDAAETDAEAAPPSSGLPLARIEDQFLLIGNIDGSGTLKALALSRSGDAVFVSDEGEWQFNLYINSNAVKQQSSFYVDDINADGIADLLVTSRSFLFGGVLLGDGQGGYRLEDRFVTGYEPIIPSAGPVKDGRIQIIAVNTRTGVFTTFIPGERYRASNTLQVPFSPSYLLQLADPAASRDFLLAAQIGGMEQVFGWGEDNILRPAPNSVGVNPTVTAGTFGSNFLRAYQVGNYASVVITDQANSFNVANLRMLPGTFLVLGDFYRQGSLDVAVGSLANFTPNKQ